MVVVVLLLLLWSSNNGAQGQQLVETSDESLYRVVWEPFRLYPQPNFSCGWGDALLGLSRAQLIRDAAEDCLREQVPVVCGVQKNVTAYANDTTDIALLSSVSCEGTYVRLLGGKVTFATRAGAPTREEVQQCVEEVMEGPACLRAIQSAGNARNFSEVESIVYTSDDDDDDVPVSSAPTNSPLQSSMPSMLPTVLPPVSDNTESGDDESETTVTAVSQGESSSKATSDSSTILGLTNGTAIVAAAVTGAVLVAALALFVWNQRRRGSPQQQQANDKEITHESIPVDTLPQNTTFNLDDGGGDHSYDSYDDSYDDGDMEGGSLTSLSAMDSLQHQPNSAYRVKDITSPSATSNSRKGGLRLVSTLPVLYSVKKSLRRNTESLRNSNRSTSRRSRDSMVEAGIHDSPEEILNVSLATSEPDHVSLQADGSMLYAADVDVTSTDASEIPDDIKDDSHNILEKSDLNRTYDTRSVLSASDEDGDALANELSQEIIMVDSGIVDSGSSRKNRWTRPSILPTLRLGGGNCSSVANNISSELYISANDDNDDDASSSTSSHQSDQSSAKYSENNESKAAAIGNVASTEDVDDESLDFRPTQDWNPDDSEVSPADDMSNGELSFWASKKNTDRHQPTYPSHQTAPGAFFSSTVSTASQQGEEIDGLDILEKLRLSPTPEASIQPSGPRRLTPRAFFLRK